MAAKIGSRSRVTVRRLRAAHLAPLRVFLTASVWTRRVIGTFAFRWCWRQDKGISQVPYGASEARPLHGSCGGCFFVTVFTSAGVQRVPLHRPTKWMSLRWPPTKLGSALENTSAGIA